MSNGMNGGFSGDTDGKESFDRCVRRGTISRALRLFHESCEMCRFGHNKFRAYEHITENVLETNPVRTCRVGHNANGVRSNPERCEVHGNSGYTKATRGRGAFQIFQSDTRRVAIKNITKRQ